MTVSLSPGIDLEVSARLCAALDANTMALLDTEARRRLMFAAVTALSPMSVTFKGSAAPLVAPSDWGPRTGWSWAIQTVTVTPLGSSDVLKLYRAKSPAQVDLNNLKFSFVGTSTVDTLTWHPGRTGFVLHAGEGLGFSGTLTSGTTYMVNFEVIQVSDDQLPYFLL